jgi:hypothetical protein
MAPMFPMPTELVYVPLEDAKLEATGLTIEEIVLAAVSEFLQEKRGN